MRISTQLAAAALALIAADVARADTVDVTSTTLLRVGQETRDGQPLGKPELVTVAPAFEILSITARGVTNPVADDLSIVVSTWGSWDLSQNLRWDNGTTQKLTGDVVTGYLSGKLLDRHLTLRVGREQVMTGVARMIHIDGGEAIAALPFGLRISGYVGVPVSERFAARTSVVSWNPVGGDLAYGGRVAWSLALPGVPGRGLDVGASANVVRDGSDPVREEVGADLRLQPFRTLVLTGLGAYSVYDERFSEVAGRVTYIATPHLYLEADARQVAPDLFLSRNSILSVFSDTTRTEYGVGATYELRKGLTVGGSYHLALEPRETEGTSSTYQGAEADARVEWHRGHQLAGAELLYLDAFENGYTALRVFGKQEFGRMFGAVDILGYLFRHDVNGESSTVTGAITAGMSIAKGLSAVISGSAGMTPFLERTFAVMGKLVYNQTYQSREVR